jgi:hypothetical protein
VSGPRNRTFLRVKRGGDAPIWVSSATEPVITKRFNKKLNIYTVSQVLAAHVLR